MATSTTCYVNPDTGALTTSGQPDWESVSGTVPGVTAPIIIRCALHGRYHEVGDVTVPTSTSGLHALEDFIRATLAAVSGTCGDWRQAWHTFSTTFERLRVDTHRNILTRPVETYLAVGRALNAPKPFPEALQALAGFQLPAEPPPLSIGGSFVLAPTGEIILLPAARQRPTNTKPLPRDKSWCLVNCQHHGWEHVGALIEPGGRDRGALINLGAVLISQGVTTCDEFNVTHDVLRRELEALPIRATRAQTLIPSRPMGALRFYQDIAAAFSRATSDIGYVVARTLETLWDN